MRIVMVQSFLLFSLIPFRSVGNIISSSRRTSFINGLKGLLDGLCGSEDPSVIIANSLLVTYSKYFYIFKDNKSKEFRTTLG